MKYEKRGKHYLNQNTQWNITFSFLSGSMKHYIAVKYLIQCFYVYIQVWRVNGQQKTLLQASDQSKFYSGDCYIFQYSYPGEDKEEHLIGTWFGRQSVEVKCSIL